MTNEYYAFKTDGAGAAPATAPASRPLVNPFVLFGQRNRGGGFFRGPLIKLEHTSGEFFRVRGEAKTLIEGGERFTTNPHELTDTWTKWINGKAVDRRVYRAINGEMAPPREALDDLDADYWPTKKDYLPMRGDDGAFCASGQIAIAEIAELVGMYGSADRHGKFPVVELDTRNFESQHGSTIYVPVFRLVDWAFWEPDTPAPPVASVPMPTAPMSTAPAPAAITTRKAADNNDTDDLSEAPVSPPPPKPNKRGNSRSDLDDEIPF